MFNIQRKFDYEDEEQLLKGKELPKGAIRFKEGDTNFAVMRQGFILGLPIMIPMMAISIPRCSMFHRNLNADGRYILVMIVALLMVKELVCLHEYIHAFCYPKEAEKTIWRLRRKSAYFVYCDAELTKKQYIIQCLAPSVVLGIIPFLVWYKVVPFLAPEWAMWIMVMIWVMVFMSAGDFANAYNAMRQVPKGAVIFNHGMHTYWR